jgi:hypothetical protein
MTSTALELGGALLFVQVVPSPNAGIIVNSETFPDRPVEIE